MSYSYPDRRRPAYDPTPDQYGPAPYELPWSEQPGYKEQMETDLTPMAGGVGEGHPAGLDVFRSPEKVDPEIAERIAVAQMALDAERDSVRAILGLDEPLDPTLTFAEQVVSQRMRIDMALNEPRVDQLSEQQPAPQAVPVAAGELVMAGAVA